MEERTPEAVKAPNTTESEVPVIHISGLAKSFWLVELERALELRPQEMFRRIVAVREVSLSVGSGQVYGFLGPNGAGKTTTIKMAMDLIRPTSGNVRLFGRDPRDPEVKRRIGYLPEHPYFYDYLKPQEILDFFGRLFGMDRSERKKRIGFLLDRVGLSDARNRSLRKFSKGMLQRLGVAQALLNDPDLLVLDEPLSGLDPMGRKEIRDIIIEERNRGKTIFFSSHILSDIEHLCDRVAIVVKGVLRREGLLSELLESERRQSEMVVQGISEELVSSLTSSAASVVSLGASTHKIVVSVDQASEVMATILADGGRIEQVQPYRDSLESLFLRETEEG